MASSLTPGDYGMTSTERIYLISFRPHLMTWCDLYSVRLAYHWNRHYLDYTVALKASRYTLKEAEALSLRGYAFSQALTLGVFVKGLDDDCGPGKPHTLHDYLPLRHTVKATVTKERKDDITPAWPTAGTGATSSNAGPTPIVNPLPLNMMTPFHSPLVNWVIHTPQTMQAMQTMGPLNQTDERTSGAGVN